LRLYEPRQGTIAIDGTAIPEFTLPSYLNAIGYVSQETFIFNGTIRENIVFGNEATTDAEVEAAARLANAHDFILATEQGYATVVGDAGVKLSGGQRQRIAIARAILRKPQIFIFDEATSSLDQVSERMVQDAINKISRHTTVLIIAHRLSTVQNADKIIVLEKGLVVEDGTHKELLERGKTYYQLFSASQVDSSI
jgi:ABC-type multidrug transport system fused ATPase/permease subunit